MPQCLDGWQYSYLICILHIGDKEVTHAYVTESVCLCADVEVNVDELMHTGSIIIQLVIQSE